MEYSKPKTQENIKKLQEIKDGMKLLDIQQRLIAVALYRKLELVLARDEQTEIYVKEENKIKNDKIAIETEKIDQIINGKLEPTKEELLQWQQEHQQDFDIDQKHEYVPIKDFWYWYLKNNDYYVQELDDDILIYLNNISMSNYFSEDKNYEKITLYFTFDENKFFKNKELSVSLSYTDNNIEKSQGTVIEWIQNPTVKYIKRRQKNKKTGEQRIINEKIQEKSFFQIFDNYSDEITEDGKSDQEQENMNLYLLDDLVQDIKQTLPYCLQSYLGVYDEDFYDSKTVSAISEEKSESVADDQEMEQKWSQPQQGQ